MLNKKSKTNEQGRSMVEMLGVLAIIGVLSVGGIAGYTTAMNNHRANETVDRLMKRAIIVSGQRLLGQTADISGFSTTDGTYTIQNTVDTTTDGKFTLSVNAVPKAVCEKIKALDWKLPVISPETCGETNNLTFTFNNDLSANTSSGNGEASADVGVCENGNVYLSYNDDPCGTETTMNAQECESGSDCWDGIGEASCCDTITHTCKAGTYYYDEDSENEGYKCVEADNKQCTKNSDCASGEFCNLMSSEWNCKPDTGTCEPIGDYTDATVTGLGSIRRSHKSMAWWGAENWCKAQGKNLIDVSKFKVYKTTNTTIAASGLLTSGANTWSFGCADGKKCGYWSNSPYNAMWSGNTLVETAGDSDGLYKDRYSPVLISLRQEFDSNQLYFWTASDYSSSDSCYAFYVPLVNGSVDRNRRYSGDYHALCE